MLDYLPNPDHVGLYQSLADGAFAQAGLDVELQMPSDPAAPLKLLQASKVDLAISYEPELLIARDKGAQLVSVGGDRAGAADLADAARPDTSRARATLEAVASGRPGSPTRAPT